MYVVCCKLSCLFYLSHAKYMTPLEDSWTEIARSMEAVVRSSGPAADEENSDPSPESYSFSTR